MVDSSVPHVTFLSFHAHKQDGYGRVLQQCKLQSRRWYLGLRLERQKQERCIVENFIARREVRFLCAWCDGIKKRHCFEDWNSKLHWWLQHAQKLIREPVKTAGQTGGSSKKILTCPWHASSPSQWMSLLESCSLGWVNIVTAKRERERESTQQLPVLLPCMPEEHVSSSYDAEISTLELDCVSDPHKDVLFRTNQFIFIHIHTHIHTHIHAHRGTIQSPSLNQWCTSRWQTSFTASMFPASSTLSCDWSLSMHIMWLCVWACMYLHGVNVSSIKYVVVWVFTVYAYCVPVHVYVCMHVFIRRKGFQQHQVHVCIHTNV